ncbi:hypothetical protein K469DRAFT_634275 [Zopfia rhizophila CBS 207.26]|uniref:C2H2 type zinc finger domain protein n=1 Tax=Zopfia rhizophila CBS 207.26 TaxID=1314779 RepID=A0A6A6E2J2_9PEZI|nr:hypothetical protein K469DRAFT_634275 [Zopfia rhizophila CBS 207.26]
MSLSSGPDDVQACSTPESPRPKQTYTCEICGAKLSRPAHLQRHQRLHSRSERETFTCQLCNKRFTRKDVYQRHRRNVHEPTLSKRESRKKSCHRCIKQKLRCSREVPCEACLHSNRQCVYDLSGPPPSIAPHATSDLSSAQPLRTDGEPAWPPPTLSDLASAANILDGAVPVSRNDQRATQPGASFLGQGSLSAPSISEAENHTAQTTNANRDSQLAPFIVPNCDEINSEQFDSFSRRSQQIRPHNEPTNWGFLDNQSHFNPLNPEHCRAPTSQPESQAPSSQFQLCDWDIVRASRMDWFGCETAVSDSLSQLPAYADHHDSGEDPQPTPAVTTTVFSPAALGMNMSSHSNQISTQDRENSETWPGVLDRGGNETWPFDYTSNKGYRKITLPPLRQVLEQTLGDRPAIEKNTLMDLIKILSAPHIPSLNDTPALEALPAVAFLEKFVKIYFAEFHAVLPIIHIPTWRIEKCPTALLAAMACIGATYSTTEGSSEISALLAEITQRALFWMGQQDTTAFRNSSYITASCFHQIYALGTGNRRLYEIADASRGLLVTSLRGLGILSSDAEQMDPFTWDMRQLKKKDPAALEAAWLQWRDKEMEKRMAWSVFEFDCTLSTLTSKRGAFRIAELPSRLPCSESIWEAHSAQAWAAILPFATCPPAGLPFYTLLRDVIAQKPGLDSVPAWAKRLCVHAIDRMLYDMRELEDASAPNILGLSSLTVAHRETKRALLASLTLLQDSLSRPMCTSDIVNMNIGSLGAHHSYLSNSHEAMDLVVYIFRNSGRDSNQQTTRELDFTKEHLRYIYVRDPMRTRQLVTHAASITGISRECTINTPCETMRVFMAYAFLLAFTKFFPFEQYDPDSTGNATPGWLAVKLDDLPWTRTPDTLERIERWIEVGGRASLESVTNICDARNFEVLKQVALKTLADLKVWGIAGKFYKTINKFS